MATNGNPRPEPSGWELAVLLGQWGTPVLRTARVSSLRKFPLSGFEAAHRSKSPVDSEETRYDILVGSFIPHFNRLNEERRAAICSAFAAAYMPRLVDVFLDPPPPQNRRLAQQFELYNAYTVTLVLLQDNRYFVKFMLSDHPAAAKGKLMATHIAQRLVSTASQVDDATLALPANPDDVAWEAIIGDSCQLLATILVLQIGKSTAVRPPASLTARLMPSLHKWTGVFKGKAAATFTERVAGLLRGDFAANAHARAQRDLWEGLQKCAKAGCRATHNLFQCEKCRTALYCGRQHQAEDWRARHMPHKAVCIRTAF